MILSNRVAPVVPFVGAFMAACNWSYKKSILYIAAGGLTKYSILLAIVGIFHLTIEEAAMARTFTLIMVVIVIVLSIVLAVLKYRREKRRVAEMEIGKKGNVDGC